MACWLGLGAGSRDPEFGCSPSPWVSPGTDPGLLFPLLRSSEEAPFSVGTRPLSGSSFPGGLGGTRMRRRKMHFFFLISLPQRNLGVGRGGESSGVDGPSPRGGESALTLLSPPPWTQSYNPERPAEMAIPQAGGIRSPRRWLRMWLVVPPCPSTACVWVLLLLSLFFSASTSPKATSRRKASSSQWNTILFRSPQEMKAPPGPARILPTPLHCPEATEGTRTQPHPQETVPGRTGATWTQRRAVSGSQTTRRWEREGLSLPSDVWRCCMEAGTTTHSSLCSQAHTGLTRSSSSINSC